MSNEDVAVTYLHYRYIPSPAWLRHTQYDNETNMFLYVGTESFFKLQATVEILINTIVHNIAHSFRSEQNPLNKNAQRL